MNKIKYIIGRFKEGEVKISLYNRKVFGEDIKKAEGKEVLIELANANKIRSLQQNAYYWTIINALAKASGTEDWKWHNFFKFTFLHDKIKKMKINDEWLAVLPSTTELSISEMADYLTKIVGDATRPGWIRERFPQFIIPNPEDYYKN